MNTVEPDQRTPVVETHEPCLGCGAPVTRKRLPDGRLEKAATWRKRNTCGKPACVKAARLNTIATRLPRREHPNATLRHRIANTPEERAEHEEVALAALKASKRPLTVDGLARAAQAAGVGLGYEDAFGALERLAHAQVIGCVTPEDENVSGIYHPSLPKRRNQGKRAA